MQIYSAKKASKKEHLFDTLTTTTKYSHYYNTKQTKVADQSVKKAPDMAKLSSDMSLQDHLTKSTMYLCKIHFSATVLEPQLTHAVYQWIGALCKIHFSAI